MGEFHLAHGLRQVAEEEGRGLLVVPDVGTGAQAAPRRVVAAFPPVEAAVGRAEAGLAAQGAQVEQGRFLDHLRQVRAAERLDEPERVRFQAVQDGHDLLHHVPGILEPRRIVVSDPVARVATDGAVIATDIAVVTAFAVVAALLAAGVFVGGLRIAAHRQVLLRRGRPGIAVGKMPGQQEGHAGRFPRRQVDPGGQ